jgi:hypothetical protein
VPGVAIGWCDGRDRARDGWGGQCSVHHAHKYRRDVPADHRDALAPVTDERTIRDHVQWQITDLLGDRVADVRVELMDHDYEIGIAIRTASGWRHGVRAPTSQIRENPERYAQTACDMLIAWIDAKEAKDQ